jgi:excinuclease ABC subunit C
MEDKERTLFASPLFEGFGLTHLRPETYAPTVGSVKSAQVAKLKEGIRESCCKLPGVYGMIDRTGRLIYIGKAKCLRVRLLSYFREKSRDPKAGKILKQARTIVWETSPNEFTALLRELELIQRFRPRFNVIGQPGLRRYHYLTLSKPPAPTLVVTARPGPKTTMQFGPFVGARRLRFAMRSLNDQFKLRDCSSRQKMHFSEQQSLFEVLPTPGCLRFEINTCLGPCVAACSRRQYHGQLKKLAEFLEGGEAPWLEEIENAMMQAAMTQNYEQAHLIKQRWLPLHWLRERLGFLRSARESSSFIYQANCHTGKKLWFAIERGTIIKVVYVPRTSRGREKLQAELEIMMRKSRNGNPQGAFDSVLLVTAWFRRYPGERENLLGEEAEIVVKPPRGKLALQS